MAAERRPLRLWDLPTRVVHWAMALLIPFSWWTAQAGQMERHRFSGYVLLGLLLFRLIWGFAGSAPSRFAAFVKGPVAVWRYVQGGAGKMAGHNPLGGWSVIAMLSVLSVLAMQLCLGLFSVDEEGFESGPLAYLVAFDTSRAVAGLHEKLFFVLVALIVLHVAAILWYLLVRRDNLISPMITGRMYPMTPLEQPRMASHWRSVGAVIVAGASAWFIARGLRF